MNLAEAATVLRKVVAYCPSQSVDEYTPDAWAEALDDIRLADALEAVRIIGRRELEPGQSRYIEPGHIRAEVRRIRSRRIETHRMPEPPPELEGRELYEWLADTYRRIGDGETVEQIALPPADPERVEAIVQQMRGIE